MAIFDVEKGEWREEEGASSSPPKSEDSQVVKDDASIALLKKDVSAAPTQQLPAASNASTEMPETIPVEQIITIEAGLIYGDSRVMIGTRDVELTPDQRLAIERVILESRRRVEPKSRWVRLQGIDNPNRQIGTLPPPVQRHVQKLRG